MRPRPQSIAICALSALGISSVLAGCAPRVLVTDAATCEPIPGATVYFENELQASKHTTNAEGEVRLPSDDVGIVTIEKAGYAPDKVAWPAWSIERPLVRETEAAMIESIESTEEGEADLRP
ncbi:MAG TPA: carboxypeptidase-like regulatory domain-containing protein, partial [Planctomycetota bacterium]|nr:carboxypeptidase-like regulatory domain-containing protein [Planctomycetota bacterium]